VIDDSRINGTMAQSLLCVRVRVHQNLKQEKILMMMAKNILFPWFYVSIPPLAVKNADC
jgi:hypothetical protein